MPAATLHGHAGCVGHAEDDHAEGIADENPIDWRFINQTGGGVIVCGEDGEAVPRGLGGLAGVGSEVHGVGWKGR